MLACRCPRRSARFRSGHVRTSARAPGSQRAISLARSAAEATKPFAPSLGVASFLSLVFAPPALQLLERVPPLALLEQCVGLFALAYALPSNLLFSGQRQAARTRLARLAARLSGRRFSLASDSSKLETDIRSEVDAIVADAGSSRDAVAQSVVQYLLSAENTTLSDAQARSSAIPSFYQA